MLASADRQPDAVHPGHRGDDRDRHGDRPRLWGVPGAPGAADPRPDDGDHGLCGIGLRALIDHRGRDRADLAAGVNLEWAFELLDTEPEVKDRPGAVTIGRSRGHVEFRDVSFSYPGRTDTLKDISFEVRPGQPVAIVGPTGAGKTTLISLLPRFYDPAAGPCCSTGTDIRHVTLASLRDQFSVVLQEPLLFSATIAENIRYGRLDATNDEVVAGGARRQRARLHRALPQATTPARRARRAAVGRRAPAHLRRPRVPEGCADPHPRRADLVDRLADGDGILDALDRLWSAGPHS